MRQIIDNLKDLGPQRLAVLGGVGLAIIAAVLIGMRTIFAPTYVPLYSQLSPGTASQMMQSLEQAGLTVDLSRNGDTISVAEDDIARARMALADAGLPGEGVPGWEIFDNMSGMGMNTFMQNVNRLRALEGELTRSIQTINGIKAARVHLVLPERAAFSRERSQASASVIVRTSANTTLSRNQAQSIQALVASAVADLDAQNVTILSASGETILAKEDAGGSDYSLQSQRSTIEEQLAQKVESILNARVGTGNSRVRVSVDLTTERERRVTQSFDPDQQVARSIETRARNSSEADGNAGTVDVGNNIPAELRDANAAGGGQSTRNENDEIINYEIGSVESEMTREPGDIERVSVAVLVNGSYGTLPDGSEGYIERSADEMATLTRLVTTAIGFDENRGDQVQVDSLEFLNYETDFNGMPGRGLGTILADNTMAILRALFALAFAAIVMLFGAKPLRLILDATSPMPALAGAGGDASMLGAPSGSAPRAIGSSAAQDRLPGPAVSQSRELVVAGQEGSREMIQIASVDGGVRQSQIKAAVDLAQEDSDGALRVLGQWLAEKDAR